MATVQVVRDGTVVIFGVAGEDGKPKRLVASLMHGKIAGTALLALRSLEVPSLKGQLKQAVTFDVPMNYRVGGISLPNTKDNRRYVRMRIPGREPLWLRFTQKIEPALVRLLQGVSAKPVNPTNNPAGAAKRFKFGQRPLGPLKSQKLKMKAKAKKEKRS